VTAPANTRSEPRWTRRKEARPEEITAAALALFVERGFAATRLEDVAARAGVSKGTVYLYFANKEDLFKAVVREGLVSPIAEMRGFVEQFPGDSFALLRMLILGWWDKVGATRLSGIPKLLLGESGNFPELVRFYLAEVVEPGHAVLTAIVRRGIARGEFREMDPDHAAMLIAAPMLQLMMWRNALEPQSSFKIDPRRYLESHLEVLAHGLGAQRGAGA
jgi:AcrR family transcriptional regulator